MAELNENWDETLFKFEEEVMFARSVRVEENLLNVSIRLAGTVAALEHKVNWNMTSPGNSTVHTQVAPTVWRFNGHVRSIAELEEWVKDAEKIVVQPGLQGREAMTYLCKFLDRPTLNRVRNSSMETVGELVQYLMEEFSRKLSYIELERQLHERVQQPQEGVWVFTDTFMEFEGRGAKECGC